MNKKLHPIMLAGTGSDVGKSILAAALCRIFKQDGYHPAPFKAQNMALNSYATPEGLEIGRAQAVQAEAAGVPCHTDMNPLLLKPSSDHTSQVVLNGRPIGNRNAYEYFRKEGREELRKEVNAAFDRLAARYNPIVMEGAGSISEINLRDTDLVNMPMACYADADVILVADIDRGGVFASVYGSVMLQTPEDRKRIKGVIINKFRGDIRLFQPGVKMMEDLCGVPVLGIIPYYKDIHIEEEDSVVLDYKRMQAVEGKINVAVVLLRHLSNFTDFNMLERDERVHLYYTNNTEELAKADIILIPGSKSTLDDLYELRRNGVAQAILRAHREGATVMGICGGYQLMGLEIHDPEGVEGEIRQLPGLGLLPVITTMQGEKVTRQVHFNFLENKEICQGYEIHMGETRPAPGTSSSPLNKLEDGTVDGYFVDAKCMGSYIHGILDNQAFIDYLLQPYTGKLEHSVVDYQTYKEEQYDKLAEHVRSHLNLPLLYQIMSEND
jgi:adenosylcobyric acid synthase